MRLPDPRPRGSRPDPDASDRGLRAWSTRRRNRFRSAIALLRQACRQNHAAQMQAHADEISRRVAELTPATVESLPRGYGFRMNKEQDRSLCHGDDLFSPSVLDPLPQLAAVEQLSRDIDNDWLFEAAASFKKEEDYYFSA